MKMGKAMVVGYRPLCSKVIELAKNALVVAADAGADRLLKYNIVPDWIVGDLDSVSEKTITKLGDWTITNKDIQKTDLEKAVEYAFEKGVDEIAIMGWDGGRIDHTLAALGMAFNPRIKLIDDRFTVHCVDGEKKINGQEKTLFSLIAMPEARVSVNGARWNLQHDKLRLGG